MLDHLRSAFNVGALFRTADCLGASKLWLCGYTATPEDAQVQRTTMGSHEHVPWAWCKTTEEAIVEIKGMGLRRVHTPSFHAAYTDTTVTFVWLELTVSTHH